MQKVLIPFLLIACVLYGSQRTVIAEEFTRTSCGYCPGAARGLVENHARSYDSLIVIAYHSGDAFANPEASTRFGYYGVSGTPTVWFDGDTSEVGGLPVGTMYPFYRHHITTRTQIDSPLEILLSCNYDTAANQGTIDAIIENTSSSGVDGYLHFVVIEDDIPYAWGGLTEVDHVMRDMVPDASGEAVTVPAGDTIVRSRNFTIDPAWNESNCKIVVFVQATSHTVYQGHEVAIVPQTSMTYYAMTLNEITGNGNGYPEPDELMEIKAIGKNMGTGTFTGPTVVSCDDPYISISQVYPYTYTLGPGDADTALGWTFNIAAGCPTPYLTEFLLCFACGDTSTIPFMITTQPGIADDMESGQGDWTHLGTRDNWHLTEHKSNSPTHSWYCGVENVWSYSNENDASLISPFFVVTPNSTLTFYHQYALETDWDHAFVEVDNGSGWWITLDEYTGTQSAWTQASYSLSDYNGQTARIRFRFVSDYSVYMEGWYIDDVFVPMLGVNELENPNALQSISLSVYPNPCYQSTDIRYQITDTNSKIIIYDAVGRLVKSLSLPASNLSSSTTVVWDGTDQANRQVGGGVYFVILQTEERELTEKIILLR